MAEVPDQAKELRLVNNVELKIALADSDAKLQKLLNLYLPPLLLKLGSPHVEVRNKVIAICQHISTRLRPTGITLPVAALLTQFKEPSAGGASQLIRTFDLLYIKLGLERLSISERLELLPSLVGSISTFTNVHHQRSLFNIILQLLPHFTPPDRGSPEDTALGSRLFPDGGEDRTWLARWFAKLMLFNPSTIFATDAPGTCPGLSKEDVDFLTLDRNKATFAPISVLAEIKVAVLKFLASGAFDDVDRYLPALIASTDTNSAVAGPADDIFRRSTAGVSIEDESVVGELYTLLLGAAGVGAVKQTLQAKLVGLLAKSKTAVNVSRKNQIERIVELGLETQYAKLKTAVFTFVTWTARLADDELTHALAPGTTEQLRYWLVSNPEATPELRGYAFETMALLASRCLPIVLEPQLEIVKFLFARLEEGGGGAAGSVEDALGILLARIAKERLTPDVREAVQEMVVGALGREKGAEGQAVKWAGRLLGFGDVVGRWIGAVSVSMGGTISEEGGKALHPYYYRLINPEAALPIPVADDAMDIDDQQAPTATKYSFPKFTPLLHYLFNVPHTLPTSLSNKVLIPSPNGRTNLPPKTLAEALEFTKRIAIAEALGPHLEIDPDEDWDRTLDTITTTDETARAHVEKFFATGVQPYELEMLLDYAWGAMVSDHDALDGVKGVWNDLAALVPDAITARYVSQLGVVKTLVLGSSTKGKVRSEGAQALGLLGSHPALEPAEAATDIVKTLAQGLDNGHTDVIAALGQLLSRLQLRGRLGVLTDSELLPRVAQKVSTIIATSRDTTAVEAATDALAELCAVGAVLIETTKIDVAAVRKELEEKAKRGAENAVLALGYLSYLHPWDAPETATIVESLFTLGAGSGVETSFVVGEALTSTAAGWGSVAVRRSRTLAGITAPPPEPRTGLSGLLDQLLARAKEPAGGGKRRTTVVALLSAIELCGAQIQALPDAATKMAAAQAAFRAFLTDRDEFIQESAARGLTGIYALSDKETQDALVRSLVASFTGEVTTAASASERAPIARDTQLFAPGQLPTGDGASVGSYGDIMSLAAELGDPSLVYKFLALARHNSVWASRAAFGRFGLGKLLQGSAELRENEKLWPVLYRYRFDPAGGVRRSMDAIWAALGGSQETVEKWWKGILQECLKGALNGREWRVREASCAAMADLLGGRRVATYKSQLQDVWGTAFRVLDDVKESVRTAAMKLCRVLTSGMVRAVKADVGQKEKEEILGVLMEFLVGRQGLEATAKEVQVFAMSALLEVIKTAGVEIRIYVPQLVERLVVMLSDLEPEAVNYLVMNADKYNTTAQDIDHLRLTASHGSPITTALDSLLEHLDAPTTASLIPVLVRSIRTSLGLPSKVGCTRVVMSLVMRKPHLLKKYADEILKALLGQVQDRSEVVGASYAIAVGYTCRVATDEGILRVQEWAETCYWTGVGEEVERRAAGRVTAAVWKHATDRANTVASSLLPFIFIAKNDADVTVAAEFAQTWTDNTGGSGAVKLHLREIVDLALSHIASAKWVTKQTCAFALAEATTAIATDITAAQLGTLWPALVTAVGGKSWVGKEKVLAAFVALAKSGKMMLSQQKLAEVEKIVLREAKRNNVAYRGPAIKCLGEFADALESVDVWESVHEIVQAVVDEEDEEDGGADHMDVDGKEREKSGKRMKQTAVVNGLKALSQAYRPWLYTDPKKSLTFYTTTVTLILTHTPPLTLTHKSTSLDALTRLISRLLLQPDSRPSATTSLLSSPAWDPALHKTWTRIMEHLKDRNYEAGRTGAVKAVEAFWKVVVLGAVKKNGEEWGQRIRKDIAEAVDTERSSIVLKVLRPCLDGLK